MKPGRDLAGAIGTAEGAELRKGKADRPESKAGRGFAASEGRHRNCGRTAEEVRKLNAPAFLVLDLAPSLVALDVPKRREVDPHRPPAGLAIGGPPIVAESAHDGEGRRPASARVLTHPTFDRPPVANPRRRGSMGAITLRRERIRRETEAQEAAQATLRRRSPHDVAAELLRAGLSRVGSAGIDGLTGEDALIAEALAVLDARLRRSGSAMNSPEDVRAFLTLKLAQRETEGFGVLFLDAAHAVIDFEVMFQGSLSQTSVYPREVVRRALALNAEAVILAHNHPSGIPEPSRADEYLTKTLKGALALVDVRVLDHMIVGRLRVVSMAERGLV